MDQWEPKLKKFWEILQKPSVKNSFRNISRPQFYQQLGYLAIMSGISLNPKSSTLPILGRLVLDIQSQADTVGLLGCYNFLQFHVLPIFTSKPEK